MKTAALEEHDYRVIGLRFGSSDVAEEAQLALGRWRRDLGPLTDYGYGPSALARVEALAAAHGRLREERSDAIVEKLGGTASLAAVSRDADHWIEWATVALGVLARGDAEVGRLLGEAQPRSESDLDRSVGALLTLVRANAARMEGDIASKLALGETVATQLHEALGRRGATARAPQVDTAELDVLDGRLYVAITDLNAAARKAIRHGALDAPASDYKLQVLGHSRERQAVKPSKP